MILEFDPIAHNNVTCSIGNRFLNEEFLDEFGRLDLVNATASQARAIAEDITSLPWSGRELVDRAVDAETSARQLVQSVQNVTTPSLSILGNSISLNHKYYVYSQ